MFRATPSIKRFLNGLLEFRIQEDLEDGAVNRRLRQIKHPLERIVGQPNPLGPIRNHHTFDHAGKYRLETETFSRDLLIELLE